MKASDQLIETIKQQGIQPTPKWRFLLKNALTWGIFLAGVALGALAFSVILFAIQQTEFNVVSHFGHSRLELFLGLLPFLWIGILVVFVFVGMYAIQHAPKGYKLNLARRVGYSAALSILLGALFFIAGGAKWLENAFAMQISIYESVQEKKIKLWMMPESGYLSGQITGVTPEEIQLIDFNNQQWTILLDDTTFIAPIVELKKGEKIKLIGKTTGSQSFSAAEIRPWGGPGKRWKNGGK